MGNKYVSDTEIVKYIKSMVGKIIRKCRKIQVLTSWSTEGDGRRKMKLFFKQLLIEVCMI